MSPELTPSAGASRSEGIEQQPDFAHDASLGTWAKWDTQPVAFDCARPPAATRVQGQA